MCILFPSFRISLFQIYYHTSFSVYTCCFCIDISGFSGFPVNGHGEGIIHTMEVTLHLFFVNSLFPFFHFHLKKFFLSCFSCASRCVQMQHYLLCCRRPHLKGRFLLFINSSQIIACIGILFFKFPGFKHLFPFSCCHVIFSLSFFFFHKKGCRIKCISINATSPLFP